MRTRFSRIKKLISKPILQYQDFTKNFILTTDTSNFVISCNVAQILSQGEVGKDLDTNLLRIKNIKQNRNTLFAE